MRCVVRVRARACARCTSLCPFGTASCVNTNQRLFSFEGPKSSMRSHVTSWVRVVMSWTETSFRLLLARRESSERGACEWGAVRIVYGRVASVNWEAALFLSTTVALALTWARTHWLCKTLLFCILNVLVSQRQHFIMLQPPWYRISAFVSCKTVANFQKKINKKIKEHLWEKRATFEFTELGVGMWMNELHFLHLKPNFSPAQYKNYGCLLCWLCADDLKSSITKRKVVYFLWNVATQVHLRDLVCGAAAVGCYFCTYL